MSIVQRTGGTFNGTSFTASVTSALGGTSKLVVLVEGDTIINTPSGWTLRTSVVQNAGHYWFERTAAGGSNSQAFTNSSGAGAWVALEIAGTFNSATGNETDATGTTQATPSHTPPSGATDLIASFVTLGSGTTRTVTSMTGGFVKQADGQVTTLDWPQGAEGDQSVTASGSTAYSSTATFSIAGNTRGSLIGSYASSGSSGSPGSVTAVPATASAAGVVPAVAAASSPVPAVATASAAGVVPAVSGGAPGDVAGVASSASGVGVAAVVAAASTVVPPRGVASAAGVPPLVSGPLFVASATATANAAAIAPVVGSGAVSITAVPATASAAGVVPTVGGQAGVPAVAGVANAAGVVPTLTAAGGATAVVATASATAVPPGVVGQVSGQGDVAAIAATASGVAVPPAVEGDNVATVLAVPGVANGSAVVPVVSGGHQAVTVPPSTASGASQSPAISGAVVLYPPAAQALTGAPVPSVVGAGSAVNVAAVPTGATAVAVTPVIFGGGSGAYYAGYGGALVFVHDDARITLTVDVFNPNGRPVVYSDEARTAPVALPLTFNEPGFYQLWFTDNYEGYLSVLRDGAEVASKPDSRGVLPFVVRNEEWLVFAPGRDPM